MILYKEFGKVQQRHVFSSLVRGMLQFVADSPEAYADHKVTKFELVKV